MPASHLDHPATVRPMSSRPSSPLALGDPAARPLLLDFFRRRCQKLPAVVRGLTHKAPEGHDPFGPLDVLVQQVQRAFGRHAPQEGVEALSDAVFYGRVAVRLLRGIGLGKKRPYLGDGVVFGYVARWHKGLGYRRAQGRQVSLDLGRVFGHKREVNPRKNAGDVAQPIRQAKGRKPLFGNIVFLQPEAPAFPKPLDPKKAFDAPGVSEAPKVTRPLFLQPKVIVVGQPLDELLALPDPDEVHPDLAKQRFEALEVQVRAFLEEGYASHDKSRFRARPAPKAALDKLGRQMTRLLQEHPQARVDWALANGRVGVAARLVGQAFAGLTAVPRVGWIKPFLSEALGSPSKAAPKARLKAPAKSPIRSWPLDDPMRSVIGSLVNKAYEGIAPFIRQSHLDVVGEARARADLGTLADQVFASFMGHRLASKPSALRDGALALSVLPKLVQNTLDGLRPLPDAHVNNAVQAWLCGLERRLRPAKKR